MKVRNVPVNDNLKSAVKIFLGCVFFSVMSINCYSYRRVENDNSLQTNAVYKIYDTNGNGKKIKSAQVKNDTVFAQHANQNLQIPVSQIKKIEKRRFSELKTGGLVIAVVLITISTVVIVALQNIKFNFDIK